MKSKYKIIVIPKTQFFLDRLLIKKEGKSAWVYCDGETIISDNFQLSPEDLDFLAQVGRNFWLFFENCKTMGQWEDNEEKN